MNAEQRGLIRTNTGDLPRVEIETLKAGSQMTCFEATLAM